VSVLLCRVLKYFVLSMVQYILYKYYFFYLINFFYFSFFIFHDAPDSHGLHPDSHDSHGSLACILVKLVDAVVLQGPVPLSLDKLEGTKILSSLFYILIVPMVRVQETHWKLLECSWYLETITCFIWWSHHSLQPFYTVWVALGLIYVVLVTRDNPPPRLPSPQVTFS